MVTSFVVLGLCCAAIGIPVLAASTEDFAKPFRLAEGWRLQDAARLSATGEQLSRPDFSANGWHRATVPGTVLTSLVNEGVYPDPLFGENNRPDKIPDDLCRTSYWYRTTFAAPKSFQGKNVWLRFNGINYMAEVWMNGHRVGEIKGAFARGIFDVTSYLSDKGENALAVHILPPPNPGLTHEKTVKKGTGPNGGILAQDGPTFLCSIGWDWIPTIRDRNIGIWQDVTLSTSGPVVIEDPTVTTDLPLPNLDSATVTVQTTIRNATDRPQKGTLAAKADRYESKHDISLAPGESKVVAFDLPKFENPRLWWPNGYGPQNLYNLHLTFEVDGKLSHAVDRTFGIRKIQYRLPDSPNLALVVNGVPVVAKGGDWGMDEAMKRIPRHRLEAQIRMHQIANYTIVRNWVGQSTSDDFYDLCDRYGILLWDEFFQPNPSDGPNPKDVDLYLANVREKILRYRSHPCIALWCARNEGNPPKAVGDGIKKIIDELDPKRLYQPSSTDGRGVNSGGPYHWRTPREFYVFGEAFKTEIGSMSVPTLEAVKAMMPARDWEVINDDWAEHDFCAGAQAGDRYPSMIASRYGQPQNLADFVRKSQLANYEAFRAMYEGRFAKLFQPVTGVITWMSNPAQPSFVWQLYSHDLEPNASLYATRKACESVHVMLNESNGHVMVVNNRPATLDKLTLEGNIYNLDGSIAKTFTLHIAASPSAVTDAGPLDFQPTGLHFVKLTLKDAHGRLLSDNFYWRSDAAHQDDLRALDTLPRVTLEVKATRRRKGEKTILDVTAHNPAKTVALMAHFQLREAPSRERVLPVFYGDNYISLTPGETKTFTVEAATEDLDGQQPKLFVDGWNVTVEPSELVAPNDAAIVGPFPIQADPPQPDDVRINCGGGQPGPFHFGAPSAGTFITDAYFEGGNAYTVGNDIDAHVPNAAPEDVYRSERWGACAYKIPVKPGRTYTVRLHFVEEKFTPGQRKFNVDVQGKRVLADWDIAAEACRDKAVVKEYKNVSPDANGQIVVTLTRGSIEQPKICGIEILRE